MLAGVREATCEMHGLGAAVGASTGGHTADHAMDMASSHESGSHESGSHESGSETAGCDCTCIGACTVSAPLATPPAAVTLRIARVLPKPGRPIDLEPARAPAREADRLLPFANGPPSASV
jgi:hypothetical protein